MVQNKDQYETEKDDQVIVIAEEDKGKSAQDPQDRPKKAVSLSKASTWSRKPLEKKNAQDRGGEFA